MTYASSVLALSPVGYWRLGEASGTNIADSSGNGYDATISGSGYTLDQAGLLDSDADRAIAFDGADGNMITVTNAAFNTSSMAFTCWINIAAWPAGSSDYLFSLGEANGYYAGISTSGKVFLGYYNGGAWSSVISTATVPTGAPVFLAFDYTNGGDAHITINDTWETLTPVWSSMSGPTNKLVLCGYYNGGTAQTLLGTLDDVAWFSSAKSQAQLLNLYRVGAGITIVEGVASGFTSNALGTPYASYDHIETATGLSSTALGAPLAYYDQIETATAIDPVATFGTARLHTATGVADSLGAVTAIGTAVVPFTPTSIHSTTFGTPRFVCIPESISPVAAFGTPFATGLYEARAKDFKATKMGTPSRLMPTYGGAYSLPRAARIGTPSYRLPTIGGAASLYPLARLGTPARILPQTGEAEGIRGTHLGRPSRDTATRYQPSGFCALHLGDPTADVDDYTGIMTTLGVGTHLGTPLAARTRSATAAGLYSLLLGTPVGLRLLDIGVMTSVGCGTAFGTPKRTLTGWVDGYPAQKVYVSQNSLTADVHRSTLAVYATTPPEEYECR